MRGARLRQDILRRLGAQVSLALVLQAAAEKIMYLSLNMNNLAEVTGNLRSQMVVDELEVVVHLHFLLPLGFHGLTCVSVAGAGSFATLETLRRISLIS